MLPEEVKKLLNWYVANSKSVLLHYTFVASVELVKHDANSLLTLGHMAAKTVIIHSSWTYSVTKHPFSLKIDPHYWRKLGGQIWISVPLKLKVLIYSQVGNLPDINVDSYLDPGNVAFDRQIFYLCWQIFWAFFEIVWPGRVNKINIGWLYGLFTCFLVCILHCMF